MKGAITRLLMNVISLPFRPGQRRWNQQQQLRDTPKPPVPGNAVPPRGSGAAHPPRLPPAPGCALCGFYEAWDPVLGWYVERYEKCPAHQEVSR